MQTEGFWTIAGRVVNDVMTQQVPGSIVIVLVGLALLPTINRAIRSWLRSRNDGKK